MKTAQAIITSRCFLSGANVGSLSIRIPEKRCALKKFQVSSFTDKLSTPDRQAGTGPQQIEPV
jgi:hypothetical protein